MANTEFDALINEYKLDTSKLESIRLYVLSHVNEIDPNYCVDTLKNVSIELGYKPGEALAYCIYFWFASGSNIEEANQNNEKAGQIYSSLESPETQPGYLTYLNNKLIYCNTTGKLKDAYFVAKKATLIAKQQQKISYFIAFSHNYSYVLQELGLFEEAYQRVRDTFDYEEFQQPMTRMVGRYMMITNLFYMNRYSEAYKYLLEYESLNKEYKIYEDIILNLNYLIYSLGINDKDNIEKYKDLVLSKADSFSEMHDIVRVYLALAKYYVYKENYDEANRYYQEIYTRIDTYTGSHRMVLKEIALMHKHFNNLEGYNKYLELYSSKTDEMLKITSEILMSIEADVALENNSNAYKVLFSRGELIQSFLSDINSTIDLNYLYKRLYSLCIDVLEPKGHIKLIVQKKKKLYLIDEMGESNLEKMELPSLTMDSYRLNEKIISFFNNEVEYCFPLLNGTKTEGYFLCDIKLENQINYVNRALSSTCQESVAKVISNAKHYQEILALAHTDHLTKLRNRQGLFQLIKDNEHSLDEYYCIMFDIDDFKKTNDTYGHPAGDLILQEISKNLNKAFSSDFTSRFGGEEFCVVSKKSRSDLIKTLDKFFDSISDMVTRFERYEIKTGISAGISKSFLLKNFAKAYKEADSALYEVKNTKKGIYKFFC